MKSGSFLFLIFGALASASAIPSPLPSNISLGLDLPDKRFSISRKLDPTLLPVQPTLLNILHFMGLIAIQDFNEELAPRTYSAPGYRQVQVTTYTWTEVRFLLWGIYIAAADMVEIVRFHAMTIDLYWDDKLVGRMRLAVSSILSLPGLGNGEGSSLPVHAETSRSNATAVAEYTDSLAESWNDAADNSSLLIVPPSNTSITVSTPPIIFESVPGAQLIKRNDVFLTFYAALLRAAQFHVEDEMQSFWSKSPTDSVYLHMQRPSVGSCQYGQVLNILIYVPKYMSEHRAFGYRETQFDTRIGAIKECSGMLVRNLV